MSSLVQRLRKAEDARSRAMLDVLRALVVFGGALWMSELPGTISQLHVESPGYSVDRKTLESAVKELEREGVVSAEKAKRATERGAEDDVLVKLRDEKVRVELSGDPVISRYFSYFSESWERLRREGWRGA